MGENERSCRIDVWEYADRIHAPALPEDAHARAELKKDFLRNGMWTSNSVVGGEDANGFFWNGSSRYLLATAATAASTCSGSRRYLVAARRWCSLLPVRWCDIFGKDGGGLLVPSTGTFPCPAQMAVIHPVLLEIRTSFHCGEECSEGCVLDRKV